MNRYLLTQCLLTATIVVSSVVAARGQEVTASQLFNGLNRCDHVIQLIHRYGVNNSVNGFASRAMLHHSPLGGVLINQADLGDLQVMQVNQIVEPDSTCGPKFAVLIRNQSCRSVCNFHVSAVGVLGRIHPMSPSTTVAVGEIAAGATLQVVLTLPIESLAMGNRNGQIIGLQTLVVAIDSYDQLAETNEANNLKAWEMGQIPVMTSAIETTVESVSAVSAAQPATQAEPIGVTGGTSSADPGVATPSVKSADPLRSAIKLMSVESVSETKE